MKALGIEWEWHSGVVAVLVLLALLLVGFPRYDWRTITIAPGRQTLVRIDRWTGHAESGLFTAGAVGDWYPAKPDGP